MRIKRALVFIFVAFCTGIWIITFLDISLFPLPEEHITNFTPQDPEGFYLKGVVISDPVIQRRTNATFILKAQKLKAKKGNDWHGVTGLIQVKAQGLYKPVRYGDALLLKGLLQKPKTKLNSRDFDYRAYLGRKKIYSCLFVKKQGFIETLATDKANYAIGKIFDFKQTLRNLLKKHIHEEPEKQILAGILLGDRENIPYKVKEKFINTGTVHILAISGLHVALIAFLLLGLFNIFHVPKSATYPLVIIILIAYSILTGARPPIVRATIMSVVFLCGFILRRPADLLNALALSGLIILCKNPMQLFDAGFQLSFIAVSSIIFITPKISTVLKTNKPLPRYIKNALCVSLAAWIGTLPVVAYYFGIISPVAVIANVFVVLVLSAIVSTGLAFFTLSFFSYTLGSIFACATSFFISFLIKIVNFFNKVPLGFFKIEVPPALFIGLYYVLLIGVLAIYAKLDRRHFV